LIRQFLNLNQSERDVIYDQESNTGQTFYSEKHTRPLTEQLKVRAHTQTITVHYEYPTADRTFIV